MSLPACRNSGRQNWEQDGIPSPDTCSSPREQRAALAQIKARIMRYKRDITALEKAEEELEASLSLIVYPILTLPNEITARIFVQCLPTHGRVRPSSSTAPLLLAQICCHWRDVALATCQLWSSIHIDRRHDRWHRKNTASTSHRILAETWLARAKGHLISLGLSDKFGTIPDALVSLVPSFSGQIRCLELYLQPQQFRRLRPLDATFPLLQHLVTSHSSAEDLNTVLAAAPSLRELCLRDADPTLTFSLPLLTHLEIQYITDETLIAVLLNCPALSHLALDLVQVETDQTNTSTPTRFPRLSSLTIGSESCAALHLLTLPNLCKLEIASYMDPNDVIPFLSRSSCALDHFVISLESNTDQYGNPTEEVELTIWLKAVPSIMVLETTNCADPNLVIGCLESPELVPHLREITISGDIEDKIDYDAIVEMLHCRRDSALAVELRKLHLDLIISHLSMVDDDEWSPRSSTRLEVTRLIEAGLDFAMSLNDGGLQRTLGSDIPEPEPVFP